MASTLSRILDDIPGAPHRPQSLARQLGLNAVLTSRLLKAAQQSDPLVVAHVIPGPEPLRRVLLAVKKKRINRTLIKDAEAAVDRFQQLIDAEAGDRSALDAIISGWLPDAGAPGDGSICVRTARLGPRSTSRLSLQNRLPDVQFGNHLWV